jgi:hypothetical protein
VFGPPSSCGRGLSPARAIGIARQSSASWLCRAWVPLPATRTFWRLAVVDWGETGKVAHWNCYRSSCASDAASSTETGSPITLYALPISPKAVLEPILHQAHGEVGNINSDPPAHETLSDSNSCPATTESIKDNAPSLLLPRLDDPFEQSLKLLRWITEPFVVCRVRRKSVHMSWSGTPTACRSVSQFWSCSRQWTT